jgi:hypothetical protein
MNNTRTFECKTASKKRLLLHQRSKFWAWCVGFIATPMKNGEALPRRLMA